MSPRTLTTLAFLALLGALHVSTPAHAYLCSRTSDTGPSLAWATRDVTLRVFDNDGGETSADELEDAMAFAAATWSALPCSDLDISIGASSPTALASFDWAAGSDSDVNVNVVTFRQNASDTLGDSWLHPFDALAITTVTYVRSSGKILDADIEVNDARFFFTSCDPGPDCLVIHDLKNTLVHEVGHVIGLDHPPTSDPDVESVTMHRRAPEGDVEKRTLAPDDEAGACALYPTGAENGECFGVEPKAPPNIVVTQSGCGGGSMSAFVVPMLPIIPILMSSRVRKRRGRTV